MKITLDITPEECKELLTPGPNQVIMFNEILNAATKSWLKTMGAMNAWTWSKKERK